MNIRNVKKRMLMFPVMFEYICILINCKMYYLQNTTNGCGVLFF